MSEFLLQISILATMSVYFSVLSIYRTALEQNESSSGHNLFSYEQITCIVLPWGKLSMRNFLQKRPEKCHWSHLQPRRVLILMPNLYALLCHSISFIRKDLHQALFSEQGYEPFFQTCPIIWSRMLQLFLADHPYVLIWYSLRRKMR